jgi:hypothetical protein
VVINNHKKYKNIKKNTIGDKPENKNDMSFHLKRNDMSFAMVLNYRKSYLKISLHNLGLNPYLLLKPIPKSKQIHALNQPPSHEISLLSIL